MPTQDLIVHLFFLFRFTLKQKGKDADGEVQTTEVTVFDYFVNHRNIELRYSADLPCINVGKPKRPTFFPIEVSHQIKFRGLCHLLLSVCIITTSFL